MSAAEARSRSPVGLVGDDQQRVGHQRPRDRHALLLAARQLVRVMLDPVRQADQLQHQLGAARR